MRTKTIPLTFLEPVHIIHNHCCIRNDEQFNIGILVFLCGIKAEQKIPQDR